MNALHTSICIHGYTSMTMLSEALVVLVVCIELDINYLPVQYVLMLTIMTLLIQELILDIYRLMY